MDKKEQDEINFEIKFYEGVLAKKPDFVEALMALGDLYTKKGLLREGLNVDERLIKLRPGDSTVLYNLACSYSLLERIDESLLTLKKAVKCGYDDFKFMEEDIDLNNLRKDSRFEDFYTKAKLKQYKSKTKSNNA